VLCIVIYIIQVVNNKLYLIFRGLFYDHHTMQAIFLYTRKNKNCLVTHSLIISRIFIIQVALQKEGGRGAHTLSECSNEFNKFSFGTINLNYKLI
jgi:hypothetical protein